MNTNIKEPVPVTDRRAFNKELTERLVKIEVKQDLMVQQFEDHEKHDAERFGKLDHALEDVRTKQDQIKETQIKLSTTVWLVGCFITLAVPVITALAIQLFK
jgi:hypothetical protein